MLIVIPMAGLGSRFADAGYKTHKPLIEVNNKSLIESLDMPEDAKWVFVCRVEGSYDDKARLSYQSAMTSKLDSLGIDYRVIWIDQLTSGATETALIGIKEAGYHKEGEHTYDGELIVTNCDQYLEWDSKAFLEASRKYDSSILTYKSTDPKNSFAEIANKKVVEIFEKKVVGDNALVGVHYWKKGTHFIDAAERMLTKHDGSRETFVSETYNYLLENNKTVGAIPIEPGQYWSTGTPADLSKFKGLIYEYQTKKPATWVFDLDGTVFMHSHKYSNLRNEPTLAPGVLDALNELDSRGDTIILMSARKESSREFTEQILADLVVPFDHLILGVSQGQRVMVNDIRDANAEPRARAVNVIADKGFTAEELQ